MVHQLAILLLCCAISVLSFRRPYTTYVTNSSDLITQSNCVIGEESLRPCVTLQMLVKKKLSGTQNLTIAFIHQDYSIYEDIHFIVTRSDTNIRLKSWKAGEMVSIVCIGDLSFEILKTYEFTIESIRFVNCGKQKHVLDLKGCSTKSATKKPGIKIFHTEFIGSKMCSIMFMLNCEIPVGFRAENSIFKSGENYSICIHSNVVDSRLIKTNFTNHRNGTVFSNANGSLRIRECSFENNTNQIRSGSAIFTNNVLTVIINKSGFLNNYNTAIYFQSTFKVEISIKYSNFTGNKGDFGGAIYFACSSRLKLSNSQFISNEASRRGGVISGCGTTRQQLHSFEISINRCTYIANLVRIGNGSVFSFLNCYKVNVRMQDTMYISNEATFGGVFYLSNTDSVILTMNTVKFMRNTARIGGTIYASLVKKFCLENGAFINNSVQVEGGAITLYSIDNINIRLCNFQNNFSPGGGGAILVEHKDLLKVSRCLLTQCIFEGNKASRGGAILMQRAEVSNILCEFSNNIASFGGAMLLEDSAMNLSEFQSFNNIAELHGGSIATTQSRVYFTQI